MNKVLREILSKAKPSRGNFGEGLTLVFTPNPEQCVLAVESAEFRECLLSGDVLLPDGIGLVWAARLLGKKLERQTGADTLERWLKKAKEEKIPTLLLGGRDGVAEHLARWYDPEGQWCWGLAGHVNVAAASDPQYRSTVEKEEEEIFSLIKTRRPIAIFVAFGAPWQELWLCRHREQLEKLGVKQAMVCGGAFDYLAGRVKRAPTWVRSIGLEWLYRLVREPWRWRRQLKLLKFVRLMIAKA
jgi:N-acetylglucosaminyldiphosphoundecaprenol N-acetyl-beta-D-mannosaminyltransferase